MAKLVQHNHMVSRNDSEFVSLPAKASHGSRHLNISLKVFNLKKMERMLFPTRDEDFKRRLLKG